MVISKKYFDIYERSPAIHMFGDSHWFFIVIGRDRSHPPTSEKDTKRVRVRQKKTAKDRRDRKGVGVEGEATQCITLLPYCCIYEPREIVSDWFVIKPIGQATNTILSSIKRESVVTIGLSKSQLSKQLLPHCCTLTG